MMKLRFHRLDGKSVERENQHEKRNVAGRRSVSWPDREREPRRDQQNPVWVPECLIRRVENPGAEILLQHKNSGMSQHCRQDKHLWKYKCLLKDLDWDLTDIIFSIERRYLRK
ncbi:1,4-alpha-glucan-branching enzyme, partial [Manis javanica]